MSVEIIAIFFSELSLLILVDIMIISFSEFFHKLSSITEDNINAVDDMKIILFILTV